MAIFHFEIRPIKRSTGQQATGAAAYRAGEAIRDERTGEVHDFSRRKDVRHSEIVLPSKYEASMMAWASDRARLWNKAEAAERRRDARVAREFQVALPSELSPEQRLTLVRAFSRELADRYGVAVDLAIHDPKPGRESDNFHAHMMTTTREVNPTGLGEKAGLDMGAVARAEKGLSSHPEEYSALRSRWAALTNEALREANVEARVDHRSLAEQGVDRKPLVHIPLEFYQLERRGVPKEAAERLREDYRTRIAAHRDRSAGATASDASSAPRGPRPSPQHDQRADQPQVATDDPPPLVPRDAEEIRRRAVQAWLRMRSREGESTSDASKQAAVSRDLDQGIDR